MTLTPYLIFRAVFLTGFVLTLVTFLAMEVYDRIRSFQMARYLDRQDAERHGYIQSAEKKAGSFINITVPAGMIESDRVGWAQAFKKYNPYFEGFSGANQHIKRDEAGNPIGKIDLTGTYGVRVGQIRQNPSISQWTSAADLKAVEKVGRGELGDVPPAMFEPEQEVRSALDFYSPAPPSSWPRQETDWKKLYADKSDEEIIQSLKALESAVPSHPATKAVREEAELRLARYKEAQRLLALKAAEKAQPALDAISTEPVKTVKVVKSRKKSKKPSRKKR